MANDPEGKDNTTPHDEISEDSLDDVSGGITFSSMNMSGVEGIIWWPWRPVAPPGAAPSTDIPLSDWPSETVTSKLYGPNGALPVQG